MATIIVKAEVDHGWGDGMDIAPVNSRVEPTWICMAIAKKLGIWKKDGTYRVTIEPVKLTNRRP